ncbi:MAG: 50S ribosomal protein L3 N(5)-glutamine methyltransferase [Gammaproteobacteria bacterium]
MSCHLKYGVESAHYNLTGAKLNVAIPESLKAMSTIRDFVRWGSSEFNRQGLSFGHGFANAIDEARYLTLYALALAPELPDSYLDCVLTIEEREQVIDILAQRLKSRKPAAYISHESWFCGLKFFVDERVLIPRSPIAELISNHYQPWIDSARVQRILDLCTGSGCIAIASQYMFEEAAVYASDISADALEVAQINSQAHGLEDCLTLYESDLFDDIPLQQFDLIVCNPPYVDAEDMSMLSEEFLLEPGLGLAAGEDGLAVVNRVLLKAGEYLSDQGVIFIELGNSKNAMMEKYAFLPMTWVEFEFGGSGVCCIQGFDLIQHQTSIEQANHGVSIANDA